MHDMIAHLIKHNAFIQFLYRYIMSFVFRTIGLFLDYDDHLVLLSSMSGDQYTGSPKVLYEKMRKDVRFKEFHYVWAFTQPEKYPETETRNIKIDSLLYFKTALRAKIWITDVNIERGLHFKNKRTLYLNTWHGTGPKKSGNAVKGRKDYDFSNVDIFCVDGEYAKNLFSKWFNVREEAMVWCGRPREDELIEFTDDDRKRIRKKFHISSKQKVILYMPTWREYKNRILDYRYWEETLGNEYMVLVRAHHFTKDGTVGCNDDGFWRNVTDYPDVNELYLAADILVSDYSSAFWDYALLKKPMFCYAYDYEMYENSTGLFLDMRKEFPNGIQRTEKELLERIKNMDWLKECEKTENFCKKYSTHTGNAADCMLNKLASKLEVKQ